MSSLFEKRDSFLTRVLTQTLGAALTISDGVNTISVMGGIARTEYFGGDASATHDLEESREFLVRASDWALGAATTPAEGVTITCPDGSVWQVHVAQGAEDPQPWRYTDESRTVFRVMTWRGYNR